MWLFGGPPYEATHCEDVPELHPMNWWVPFKPVNDSFMQCCVWDGIYGNRLFKDDMFYPGLFSTMIVVHMTFNKNTFKLKDCTTPESYDVLFYFLWSSLARQLVPAFFALFPILSCSTNAFIESFVTIFEIEMLAHLCIDRYVAARYITNGWEHKKNHKWLYLLLCTGFASFYSMLPYYGIVGNYTYDFDCATCSLDMMLPEDGLLKWSLVCLYFLKSVKPVIAAFLALFFARKLEKRYTEEMKSRSQSYFTQVVGLIACVNVLMWSMWFLVRSTVIYEQLTVGGIRVLPLPLLEIAVSFYAISTFLTGVVVLGANYHLNGGRFTCMETFRTLTYYCLPYLKRTTPVADVPVNNSPKHSDNKEKEDDDGKDK